MNFRLRTDWMNSQASSPTGLDSDGVVGAFVQKNDAVSVSTVAAVTVSGGRFDGTIGP